MDTPKVSYVLVLFINVQSFKTSPLLRMVLIYILAELVIYKWALKSTRDMIEKVNITDANVVELIREKLPAATEANKGLMQANGFEQGKNILNEEYDSKISAGVYSSTDNLNNMGTGILLALRGFQYTAVIFG